MDRLAITDSGAMRGATKADQLRGVANQLEGLFLKQLLERMDAQPIGGGEQVMGGSNASKQFSELLHTALSEKAAGSLGLADTIYAQLASRAGIDAHQKGKAAAPTATRLVPSTTKERP